MPHVQPNFMRYVCERNLSYTSGELAQNTTGSCTALALSAALGMPYKHAENWVFKHLEGVKHTDEAGKTQLAGAYVARNLTNLVTKLGRDGARIVTPLKFGFYVESKRAAMEREGKVLEYDVIPNCRLSTFVKNHPTGRYFVSVRRHAIAVVNGQIFDNNLPLGLANYTIEFAVELGTKK